MAEHYTANTESVGKWCNACQRVTQHAVSGNKVGRCMEHTSPLLTKKQQENRERLDREAANPRLF